jgi:hypothetical protein
LRLGVTPPQSSGSFQVGRSWALERGDLLQFRVQRPEGHRAQLRGEEILEHREPAEDFGRVWVGLARIPNVGDAEEELLCLAPSAIELAARSLGASARPAGRGEQLLWRQPSAEPPVLRE